MALFIAYMYGNKYAPSTVRSYVSALGYSHKFLGLPDPTKAFFIIQILKGYGKIGSRLDSRLPITLPVLHRIIESSTRLAITCIKVVNLGLCAQQPFLPSFELGR